MKILFVNPYYIPAKFIGGVLSITKSQAEMLANNGEDVTIITSDVIDENIRCKIETEVINNVKVIRFRNFNNVLSKRYNFHTAKGLFKWAKQNIMNYDVIHIVDIFTFNMFFPVVYFAKKYNVPFIIQPHGCLNDNHLKAVLPLRIIKEIILFFEKPYFKIAKYIITTGPMEENDVKKRFGDDKLVYLPNSVKKKNFKIDNVGEIKMKYNVNENDKIILYLGRLVPVKRIDIIIKAIKLIENTNIKLFIAGPTENNYDEALIKLTNELNLQDRVSFFGFVSEEEKVNLLNISNIFILISKSEGGPLSVIEAIQAGIPALVSRPASSIYIEKCNVGKVIDEIDEQSVADSISDMLDNKELYNNFDKKSQDFIDNFFSEEKMLENLLNVYKN